jgi:hypothetical protein
MARVIPAGLTTEVENPYSPSLGVAETRRKGHYTYKTELRVIGFKTGESQY